MGPDDRYIADVYLMGDRKGRTVAYRALPGATINFRGGCAVMQDPREVTWALAQPDMKVVPRARHLDFLSDWLRACPVPPGPQAEIEVPPGTLIGPAPGYRIDRTGQPPPERPEALVEFEAAIADMVALEWDPPGPVDARPFETGLCARCGRLTYAARRGVAAPKYCSQRCNGLDHAPAEFPQPKGE